MSPHVLTPKTVQDLQFNSFLDPNAFSYLPTASQFNGYYTPNSGSLGPARALQSQLDEFQQPPGGVNMMTPLSLTRQFVGSPMNADGTAMDFSGFDQQCLPQQYNAANQFTQQPTFAPNAFVHRDSGYGAIDEPIEQPGLKDMGNPTWGANQAELPYAEGAK